MPGRISGAIPDKGSASYNLGDLLASGILGNNLYQKNQQDRQDKLDELDLKRQQLSADKENQSSLRKSQQWLNINAQAEKAVQDAINNGTLVQGDTKAMDAYRNRTILNLIGVGQDGKISSASYGNLPVEAQSFVDQFKTSSNPATVNRPTADASGTPTGNALIQAKGNDNKAGFNPLVGAVGAGSLGFLLNAMKNGNIGSGSSIPNGNPFVGGGIGQANNIQDAYKAAVQGNMMNRAIGLPSPSGAGAMPMGQGGGMPVRNSPIELPGPRPYPSYTPEQMQGMQMGAEGGAAEGGASAMGVGGPVFGDIQDRLGTMQAIQALMNVMRGPQGQQQNQQQWQQSMQT